MHEITRGTLDTEHEIEAYLADLLKTPSNRSMSEVVAHLDRIPDQALRDYYLKRAKALLDA